ncbi:MAG TPA: hypothetical protein VND92_02245 [Vicinamibacterales bacterium]|nr:hypothetical protein [Vicinamibacterales bacterium]
MRRPKTSPVLNHGTFASWRFRRDVDRCLGSLCALETGGIGSFRWDDTDRIARVSDAVIEAIERRLLVHSGIGHGAKHLATCIYAVRAAEERVIGRLRRHPPVD